MDWLFIIFSIFSLYVGPKWYAFLFLDCVYDQSDEFYFLRILYIGPKPYNIYNCNDVISKLFNEGFFFFFHSII